VILNGTILNRNCVSQINGEGDLLSKMQVILPATLHFDTALISVLHFSCLK
jgi:hypothetical protein